MMKLKELLASKKFKTTLIGVAVAIAAYAGFDLDVKLCLGILAIFAMLVGAQGLTDHGKEAAKETTKMMNGGPGNTAAMLALFMLGAIAIGGTSSGCGPSAYQKTVRASLLVTDAAHDGFIAYDRERQAAIIEAATSKEQGQAELHAYRERRGRLVELFDATYRAIAAAAVLEERKNLDGLTRASELLVKSLRDFSGGKLP
jgi:hypothetical protein